MSAEDAAAKAVNVLLSPFLPAYLFLSFLRHTRPSVDRGANEQYTKRGSSLASLAGAHNRHISVSPMQKE